MASKQLSNLDLVDACDSFPYVEKDKQKYDEMMSSLWTLVLDDGTYGRVPLGLVTDNAFQKLLQTPTSVKGELEVHRARREFSIFQLETEKERSKKAADVANYWRVNKTFAILSGWRNELYPCWGPDDHLLWSVERCAAALFGITMYGAHMTAFTKSPESSHGIKIWVPQRAAGKQTYGGMLDNTVAGGMATGENPLLCISREAEEEASLPMEYVKEHAEAAGAVSYIYLRSALATGETGLVQPEVQYIFDLELPGDMVPKPNDSEVECFYLWTVEEVHEHLAKGRFKPNCALVLLDFFIRRGILTPDNEPNFEEIKRRVHRPLPFPGPHRKDQQS
jgi:isopentenyldiphosphate isomerase